MEIPKKNLLFLKGVFPEDCTKIEDQYIENLNEDISNQEEYKPEIRKKIIYDKIQKHFTDINSWVETTKNTKIKCWYCESTFMGVPVFIPSSINDTPKGKVYDVYGVFCGFSCAYSFITSSAEFIQDKSQWDKIEMLKMLYYKFYNKKIDDIISAPNKFKLEQYGGDMTIVDFRKELKKNNSMNLNNTFS